MPNRPHPLASLTPDEANFAIAAARQALLVHSQRQSRSHGQVANAPSMAFYELELAEDASSEQKASALRGDLGVLSRRRASLIVADASARAVYRIDAPTSANDGPARVLHLPKVQPPFTCEEYGMCEALVLAHAPLRAACARRGVDISHVRVDPWCVGWYSSDDDVRRRLAMPILYVQERPSDNLYARPLEGIEMKLDMWASPPSVVAFCETARTAVPAVDELMNFPDAAAEAARPTLLPLLSVQPRGAGFTLSPDGVLEWQRWSAVVGFTAREGVVLRSVRYGGRPVAWRLSFAEMVVPYGDPKYPHCYKNAFDAGEDGLGRNAHSLDASGCDCAPGSAAAFLDALLLSQDGATSLLKNAVCVHEEDAGVLWKHHDWRSGEATTRRGRRLVAAFSCTIANYTYGFAFKLGLDGTIEFQCALTGILSLGAFTAAELEPNAAQAPSAALSDCGRCGGARSSSHATPPRGRPYGQTISRNGLYAPDHQHFFVARLDMAVDGVRNRVVEVESRKLAAHARAADAHGGAFSRVRTVLGSEARAAREAQPHVGRHWLVENASGVMNRVGEATAWRLDPGAGSALKPAAQPDATYLMRAGFLKKNLWVTSYDPAERYPSGAFPSQRGPSQPDGLEAWVERDRSIDGADVVLWHVFGVHHVVRLEDYPVMPTEHVGFAIKPCGFFDASPCVDVPCTACDAPPHDAVRSRL